MTLKRVFFDAIRDDGVTDAGWVVDDDEMLTSCEELSSKFRDKNTPRFVYAARAAKVEGEAECGGPRHCDFPCKSWSTRQ